MFITPLYLQYKKRNESLTGNKSKDFLKIMEKMFKIK